MDEQRATTLTSLLNSMFKQEDEYAHVRPDVHEQAKARKALDAMKKLEEEMSPLMSTIVCSNGAVISSTNSEWLNECKKRHERTIRTIVFNK